MNAQHSEVFLMACYVPLERLVPPQSHRKVAKNLLFSAKIAVFLAIFVKSANSSQLCADFAEELDVVKEHSRPLKKFQNVRRSSKKVSMFYEQYFLYFFKIENKLIT